MTDHFLGIDIGASTSKAVLTRGGEVIARHSTLSGVNYRSAAEQVRDVVLGDAGISRAGVTRIIATGIGAGLVDFADGQVADIRCCARGMNSLMPSVRTVIDVGGQSTQVLRISETGQITNLVISEKCASGAGRFLDIIANVLQIPLEEIGPLSLKSANPITFTTACAVFGESEAVSRVAEGVSKEDILAGVHRALAEKIASLVDRVKMEPECGMSGGGALNPGLVEWVQRRLGFSIRVPEYPQLVTAYGAAIFARETSMAARQ